ncbi:hypothetical protein H072_9941 [Dactylellina haptotyla CBS 200.50]|uniref:Uncharacterized protein n=1 Tax=Dactylellina haptotyla (strain CBS 200.50) TaxID=1284197 RepID=S8A5W0_DACHA|nr:hypothetical protein H072_9941 [Dactylellina haptotyla CBS 200.50]
MSQEAFGALYQLFDLILILSELDISDPQLPFAIIEETLDTQPIEGCKQVFLYLEARIEHLTIGVDGTKGKGITLLRLCNELLRRLSKSEDTVFCGRIFVFLTKSFPLSERSGVNLRGEFHVENRTTFDDQWLPRVTHGLVNESENVENQMPTRSQVDTMDFTTSEAALAVDTCHKLYTTLWSTQHDFAEPIRLFQKPNLENFKDSLEVVIKAFKASIDEHGHHVAPTMPEMKTSGKQKRDENMKEDELDSYNPKYLTSRELFDLEVRDLVFRRHILVQFLIVIEFLLSLSLKYKRYLEADAKNRSVQFAYTLSEEDDKWAETAKKDIVNALNYKSGMDGLLFSRTVDSVLAREKNWVKWKAENCISFEMEAVPAQDVAISKLTGDQITKLTPSLEYNMGAPALSKAWFDNNPDLPAMTSLTRSHRIYLPDYKEYGQAIEMVVLDKDFAVTDQEKEEIDSSISNKSWRALRIASRDRFHFFKNLDEDLSIKSLLTAEEGLATEKKDSEREAKRVG